MHKVILDKLLRVNYGITQLYVIPQLHPVRCKRRPHSPSAKSGFIPAENFFMKHQKVKNMAEEFQALWFVQTSWCPWALTAAILGTHTLETA